MSMGFKLIEKLLLAIFGIALMLTYFKVTGASTLCLVSFPSLAVAYILCGRYLFQVEENGEKQNSTPFSVVAGLVLGFFVTGILFRLFHWRMHLSMFFIGLISVSTLWMVSNYMRTKSDLKLYYRTMLMRSAIFMSVGFILLALHHKQRADAIEESNERIDSIQRR
jgi:hypothetical protein